MERRLEDIYPISDIEHDCIVSVQGDVTVAFEVLLPEIFTRSTDEYEALHQAWVRAIKVLPKHSVLHKQDWFTEARYRADFMGEEKGFLSRSSERFFNERPYLSHSCYVFLTRKPAERKTASSAVSNLMRKSIVPEEVLQPRLVQEFIDNAGQFAGILSDCGFVTLRRIKKAELISTKDKAGLIENYCYLLNKEEPTIIREMSFKDGIEIGEKYCQLYTLADAEDLPPVCGSRINYDKYSSDKSKFSIGFAAPLGLLLPCNHIYNQYVFIDDAQATIKKLESKRLRLQSMSAYSRENTIGREAVNDFLNEAIGDQRTPVKAHFNVLVWSENKEQLKEIKNLVSTSLSQMEAMPKLEVAGAAQIFWGGIPGNEGDFPSNDCFDTFAEQASCFFNQESNYRSSLSAMGVRFGERLNGSPVHVDISDEPMRKGIITNRNKVILGPSGGGRVAFN